MTFSNFKGQRFTLRKQVNESKKYYYVKITCRLFVRRHQMNITRTHQWKFFRYGGIDQVNLESSEDLLALESLDPKLWAAMACPVENLEFDEKTLEYLDTDGDKRIKITEILAAVKWICGLLKTPSSIFRPASEFPVALINDTSEDGARLSSSIRHILKNLGKENAETLTLDDLSDTKKIFSLTSCNGDGIVTSDAATSPAAADLIKNIKETTGSEIDRSDKPGVSADLLEKFLAEAQKYVNWQNECKNSPDILFAGEQTHELVELYQSVAGRIDDYFIRCQLSSYDENYSSASLALEKEYISLLKTSLTRKTDELKDFPIALVAKDSVLHLKEKINPAWAVPLNRFAAKVLPVTGHSGDKLSFEEWLEIKGKFKPYMLWLGRKSGETVEKLGLERLNQILSSSAAATVKTMIDADKALEPQFNAISDVDKLVRYYLNLHILLNNFVSFKNFYDLKNKAIFQCGTLYMDSRSCELCVKVKDLAKHSSMAASCNIFLVYCECIKQGSGEKMLIAAAFTDGDSDQLQPGRNGIFIDRGKNFWEATIVKIIDHPISIRQAFWQPYRRLGMMIHEQIEKYAGARDKSAVEMLGGTISETSSKITAPQTASKPGSPPQPPFDAGRFAGIFAAIGLAIAALGSVISSVISGFLALYWWQMPLAIVGVLLLISGPSMILAALRLGKRNLGAILDANGWAVNTRATINIKFGKSLTAVAELPKGAIRSFNDPFADNSSNNRIYVLLAILVIGLLLVFRSPESTDCLIMMFTKLGCCK